MAASSFYLLHNLLTRRRDPNYPSAALKSIFFFMPTTLALATSLLIVLYISSTSTLFLPHHLQLTTSASASVNNEQPTKVFSFFPPEVVRFRKIWKRDGVLGETEDPSNFKLHTGSRGMYINDTELFHDRDVFFENYEEMNRSFKIYVYSHKQDDPFANVLLPVVFEPGGNYASESYFKKNLVNSHFITKDPSTADLFFLPFSIARLRHDPRVGINGIQDFIRDYIFNISHEYPYWNRSGGADHFYVACHSIGRSAMDKVVEVKLNAIQIVCSSSYYLSSYVAHKDASLPQIWPRQVDPPNLAQERSKLAFFAGTINSPVREKLLQVWQNDSEISVHFGHLTTSYSKELLGSKFCLHVKGFEVNTARIGDALYYGCVPVIIANHYDLPFQDILNWNSFSIVVATLDIPLLKRILQGISVEEYLILQNNVFKVRKHFHWHLFPVDYDAFYLVMYELWLRRSSSRVGSQVL
ncbi:probable glycosyltransferase At5g03795 [Sesamum indicum]|uniref:Probable glycosyltransferase At5g03795 n=1 Tax=Sesamum indicum TaxID=4182 RepID=A0A6I9U9B0_SESIN|nr:probable glycosyltransferase At5g03795 [Sesamum indicum]